MQLLNHEVLTSNAYRTLGLSATASQQDVDRAVRRMRIWPDASNIPPTQWDLPALGKISRTKNDLEQAVSRLNEPQSRVRERLLWFHTDAAAKAGPSPEAMDSTCHTWARSADPAARHDAALVALHAALMLDPAVNDASRWRRAMDGFSQLATSDEYRQWLYRAENDADFDKRAEFSEIDAAIQSLPQSIAGSLVGRADEALGYDDFDSCGRILQVLNESGNTQLQCAVLDRIEESLERRCERLCDEMQSRIRCDRDLFQQNTAWNRQVCMDSAHAYNDSITPLLTQMESLCVDDCDRIQRSRGYGAKTLAKIALCWVWAGDYVTAEKTYNAALQMAIGTSQECSIRADMEENAGRAQRQRMGAAVVTMNRPQPGLAYRGAPARVTNKGSTGGWTAGGIGVAFLIFRLIAAFGLSGSSSSSPSTTYTPYTPPPMPSYPTYSPSAPAFPSYPGNTTPGRSPNPYPSQPSYPGSPRYAPGGSGGGSGRGFGGGGGGGSGGFGGGGGGGHR